MSANRIDVILELIDATLAECSEPAAATRHEPTSSSAGATSTGSPERHVLHDMDVDAA